MFYSKIRKYGYNESITIYNEATTINILPSPFVTKTVLETKIQSMFCQPKENFDEKHKELINLKYETLHLLEDTMVLKEKNTKF